MPPLAIHTDADAAILQQTSECFAGELTALIRAEDVRLPITLHGFLETSNDSFRFKQRQKQAKPA